MDDLRTRISTFITGSAEEDFESLALQLFEYQYRRNAPYQRLCIATGITDNNIASWRDIPAVPALAFKLFELSCEPIENCQTVFFSSGTTSDKASRHYMDSAALELYEQSLTTNYRTHFQGQATLLAVMPPPDDAPNSSLSHMLGTLSADGFVGEDIHRFGDTVDRAVAKMVPVTVFGTAFGIAELLSYRSFQLPHGSKVIETGGFKGRYREIERTEFYGILRNGFALSDNECFSEYGMCEMASQFYSNGVNGRLYGPNWVRTRCIDPITNDDTAPGSPGLLRHYDLANLNSVSVIQTQDRAILFGDGGFQLLGRATDAELRGCSLTAEELWSK